MYITLEEVEGAIVGRIYIDKVKTSAYIVPTKENYHMFSKQQLDLILNQIF